MRQFSTASLKFLPIYTQIEGFKTISIKNMVFASIIRLAKGNSRSLASPYFLQE